MRVLDVHQKAVVRGIVDVGAPNFVEPYTKGIETAFALNRIEGGVLEGSADFDFDFIVVGSEVIAENGIITIPPRDFEPISILHAPPGDGSSVTLEAGSSLSVSTDLTGSTGETIRSETTLSSSKKAAFGFASAELSLTAGVATEAAWERSEGAGSSMSVETTQSFTAENTNPVQYLNGGDEYSPDDGDLVISLATPYKVSSERACVNWRAAGAANVQALRARCERAGAARALAPRARPQARWRREHLSVTSAWASRARGYREHVGAASAWAPLPLGRRERQWAP